MAYTLKYRRFDQLLSDISVEMPNYALENMIEPQSLIKVARACNYDLGLKIYQTKEVILDVEKGHVRLPDDFYVFNFGLLCTKYEHTVIKPQGVHIEHVTLVPGYKSLPDTIDVCNQNMCNTCNKTSNDCGCPKDSCNTESPCAGLEHNPDKPYGDYCVKPRVFVNCKGDCVEIIQKVKAETKTYSHILPLKLKNNGFVDIDGGCPNLHMRCEDEIEIKNGFLYTSFECGKVYLNYQGNLEDEEGNLLVPDHDGLNSYYEYALKKKILEVLFLNDENVTNKLQLVIPEFKEARKAARSLVNMPDYAEMKRVWQLNRQAQYKKYYRQFQAVPWFRNINLGLY
jgi:hypothetical protein